MIHPLLLNKYENILIGHIIIKKSGCNGENNLYLFAIKSHQIIPIIKYKINNITNII
jgi:hypothetical protein